MQVGLAACALSAYIRAVLRPDLAGFVPRCGAEAAALAVRPICLSALLANRQGQLHCLVASFSASTSKQACRQLASLSA